MSAALTEAYKNELMVGRFPVCVLDISLPCELVDVNVHPAKTEVKFVNEEEVYRALVMVVRGAVTRKNSVDKNLTFLQRNNAFKTAVETPLAVQEKIKNVHEVKSAFAPIKPAKETPLEKKSLFESIKTEPKRLVSTPEELPVKKIESLEIKETEVVVPKAEPIKEPQKEQVKEEAVVKK
ncbi:MAG: hypothetical protein IJ297_06875, partial [Clostridia bacterium]|nr:hypothetical protein [Clostridia bacterium]